MRPYLYWRYYILHPLRRLRASRHPAPWWRRYPVIESRQLRSPSPADHPDPRLAAGTPIRLKGKPEQIRRVLKSEWHRHRHCYVYIVETSAPPPFEPYWFADQLDLAEPPADTMASPATPA